jgi:hypothetical protein
MSSISQRPVEAAGAQSAEPFREGPIRNAMLERERSGYRDHPRLEGGEFSVGHVAEPFRDRIGRKMQIQGLRWTAITAV